MEGHKKLIKGYLHTQAGQDEMQRLLQSVNENWYGTPELFNRDTTLSVEKYLTWCDEQKIDPIASIPQLETRPVDIR